MRPRNRLDAFSAGVTPADFFFFLACPRRKRVRIALTRLRHHCFPLLTVARGTALRRDHSRGRTRRHLSCWYAGVGLVPEGRENPPQALEEPPQLVGMGQRDRADLRRVCPWALLPDDEPAVLRIGDEHDGLSIARHAHFVALGHRWQFGHNR